jgi:hypothetical protein
MAKSPRIDQAPEGDPKKGDAILKRMLQMKPKPHKEMVDERHKGKAQRPGKSGVK